MQIGVLFDSVASSSAAQTLATNEGRRTRISCGRRELHFLRQELNLSTALLTKALSLTTADLDNPFESDGHLYGGV